MFKRKLAWAWKTIYERATDQRLDWLSNVDAHKTVDDGQGLIAEGTEEHNKRCGDLFSESFESLYRKREIKCSCPWSTWGVLLKSEEPLLYCKDLTKRFLCKLGSFLGPRKSPWSSSFPFEQRYNTVLCYFTVRVTVLVLYSTEYNTCSNRVYIAQCCSPSTLVVLYNALYCSTLVESWACAVVPYSLLIAFLCAWTSASGLRTVGARPQVLEARNVQKQQAWYWVCRVCY